MARTLTRKRIAPAFILLTGLGGCSGQIPTAPSAAVPLVGSPTVARTVSGVVITASGACIAGAVVEVIAGQALGQTSVQPGPCDAWWPFNGFAFSHLTPGVSLTLRATAPGYVAKETTVKPDLQPVEVLLEALTR